MTEKHPVDDVFGVSRDLPLNYVDRREVDNKFIDSLSRTHHIVIYGSSKQGKTCLRKHCLSENDYEIVHCSNKWSLEHLHASILKEVGYATRLSQTKTVSGNHKICVNFQGKGGVPLVAEGKASASGEYAQQKQTSEHYQELELDPADVNDIIRALEEIKFSKFIVLEDFHYLPEDTQRDFSFALKAFHENSSFCFIIIGVWREDNRLIGYNGDLTDRVYSVDVDTWSSESLDKVIAEGEKLLNVNFVEDFRSEVIENSFNSVYLVQEACRRCCREQGVFETQDHIVELGNDISAKGLISEVVQEQTGRYLGFLMSFASGFQQTDLEMPRWIVFAMLQFDVSELNEGIKLRDISKEIKKHHPRGKNLNNGNVTQTLKSAGSLQVKKNIRPIVIDYDASNLELHVVDKGFLTWLDHQDRSAILEDVGFEFFDEE